MQATITVSKVNIRDKPSTGGNDIGDVYAGDRLYGEITNGWIQFNKVFRKSGAIDHMPANTWGYVAVRDPMNSTTSYATLADVPEPVVTDPAPVPTDPIIHPLTMVISSDDYSYKTEVSPDGSTLTITLTPRA